MARISLIAIIDKAGGLGINNQLLCHLPADLQHFKKVTMGKPIIMGRKTFSSLGKPLPGRINVVLSHSSSAIEGVLMFNSLSKAISQFQESEEIMVIGGAEIFKQSMEIATRLYITRIHHQFKADAHFPNIDEAFWTCLNEEHRQPDDHNPYAMTFYIYERNPKPF